MTITSTRSTNRHRRRNTASSPTPPSKPDFNDSWSVPRWLSKPRSAISSTNNLLSAADSFGWMDNPLPSSTQTAISALGAGFAVANVSAELIDGDFKGALWDVGNGVVSLTSGAKLLGLPKSGARGLYAAGAVLNTFLAIEQFRDGETAEGCLRLGNVTGLALSVAEGLVGGSVGCVLGNCGLALRGVVGLTSIVRDLTDKNGFLYRPDRFS